MPLVMEPRSPPFRLHGLCCTQPIGHQLLSVPTLAAAGMLRDRTEQGG